MKSILFMGGDVTQKLSMYEPCVWGSYTHIYDLTYITFTNQNLIFNLTQGKKHIFLENTVICIKILKLSVQYIEH